jgi:hypothetical protein
VGTDAVVALSAAVAVVTEYPQVIAERPASYMNMPVALLSALVFVPVAIDVIQCQKFRRALATTFTASAVSLNRYQTQFLIEAPFPSRPPCFVYFGVVHASLRCLTPSRQMFFQPLSTLSSELFQHPAMARMAQFF